MITIRAAWVGLGLVICLPIKAAAPPSPWPEKGLAQFVFEHIDLTSFRNSTGPRRSPGQRLFKELGITPDQMSESEAASTTDGWIYSIRVLQVRDYTGDGIPEALICFNDVADNGGSYRSQHSYVLQFADGRAIALALDDMHRAEKLQCPDAVN